MEKHLIINADDFGLAPGVNQAVFELYELGLVKSSSIMVNMPGFQDAIRRLYNKRGLGVGLHFNLSAGSPIAPPHWVPSLVDDNGNFSEDLAWNENDVLLELKAQMNRLISTGIRPTHIDSHRFIQTQANVCRPMISIARSMNLPMRRTGWEPALNISSMPRGVDKFFADAYFEDDGKSVLLNNLHSLPYGTSELICHPGYVDEYLIDNCSWTTVREIELSVLKDPEIMDTINELGIRLINYRYI